MSRFVFEFRVLAHFLWEIISFPGSTSRIHLDDKKRTIDVTRGRTGGQGMSGGFLATMAVLAALAAWYWNSPWPVALSAAYVALVALDLGRGAARHSALLWALSHPARPLRMRWSFSVILTERAWDTLGVPAERRQELQRLIGEYPYRRTSRFKGHPAPA